MTTSFKGKMSKDEFFKYFREETPLKEGEKIEKRKEVTIGLEDIASNDQKSFDNLSEILQKTETDVNKLRRLGVERKKKRAELDLMSEAEKNQYNEDEHNKEEKDKADKIQSKSICKKFRVYENDILSRISSVERNNIIIVDPASKAFSSYKNKYIGTGDGDLSERIYRTFDLYEKEHRIGNLSAPDARFNINSLELKPKIKGLIHAIGPDPSRGTFMSYYKILDETIEKISNIIKDLKINKQIDDDTEIRLPLFSLGGDNSKNMKDVYYPKLIESIKKHFNKYALEPDKPCELINLVTLFPETEENFNFFEIYNLNRGKQESWVYDFDGVVHSLRGELINRSLRVDISLENLGFLEDPSVLKSEVIKNTIKDMKKGKGFARIKIATGHAPKFKEPIAEFINFIFDENGMEDMKITPFDVYMPSDFARGVIDSYNLRGTMLEAMIKMREINIYKYVDDEWDKVEKIIESYNAGFLQTLHLLYYVSSKKEYQKIDLLAENLDYTDYKLDSEKLEGITTKEEEKIFLEQSLKLLNCYKLKYAFPYEWSIEYVIRNFDKLKDVKVYYDRSKEEEILLDTLIKLVREREPTNISGRQLYNVSKLKNTFGYTSGFYNTYFDQTDGKLAPNIAVYTETKVVPVEKSLSIDEKKLENVKIINCMGYAFDGLNQRDYQYFFQHSDGEEKGDISDEKKEELKKAYENVFNKIFFCACQNGCDTIAMSLIGSASFAFLFPGGLDRRLRQNLTFIREIFAPSFEKIKKKYKDRMTKDKFKIIFMGTPKGEGFGNFFKKEENLGFEEDYEDIGKFPANIGQVNDTEKTLFVNAWDMLSVPGNGNEGDKSLDGYIGRNTAIAVLGTGLTNPFLKDNGNGNYISVPGLEDKDFASGCDNIPKPDISEPKIFKNREDFLKKAEVEKLKSMGEYTQEEILQIYFNVYGFTKDDLVEEIKNRVIEVKNKK